MSVFFENRNGLMHAFDTTTNAWIECSPIPWVAEDETGPYVRSEATPEQIRAALEARGVGEVFYHPTGHAWLNKIAVASGTKYQSTKFAEAARAEVRPTKIARWQPSTWIKIQVSKIDSGRSVML